MGKSESSQTDDRRPVQGLSLSVAWEVTARFLGEASVAVMSVGLMVSAYGSVHSTMLTGTRIPFALARSGLLPPNLGQLSARRVPAVAIVTVGAWSTLLSISGHVRHPDEHLHLHPLERWLRALADRALADSVG